MPVMSADLRSLALAAVLLPGATAMPAIAHPHIFAEARLDVVVGGGGEVTALRHLWRFDDGFTATVMLEFDLNGDLELDAGELESVAAVVHESLADYDYFQFVTAGGKDVAMVAPERLIADMQDNRLIILFESLPKERLILSGTFAFGVYDPTFYTAIDYVEDDLMAVENMPASCAREVVRPDPDEAIAQNQQTLTDAFFDPEDTNDMSKIFATRLELRCPA
jgi:ABC-type uncharacterized transport system substrate-binding protein